MKKRFVSKKSSKFKLLKVIGFVLIVYVSFLLAFKYLFQDNLKGKVDSELIIKYLLKNSINSNIENLLKVHLSSPSSFLSLGLSTPINNSSVVVDTDEEIVSGEETQYINDPNPIEVKEPLVYLYNTHQLEGYNFQNLASYNIKPNVQMASYILKEKLIDLGIPTIVETRDIGEILRMNSWAYKYSYKASKLLIEDTLSKNKSIKYIIDIHRDSSSYEKTTLTQNGKSYARILLVVGKEHKDYQENLALATKLMNLIKTENEGIFRSIMIKFGPGVNGIYNQDISKNALLIEMGGQYNKIEEINNTIPILAKCLWNLIREEV